MLRDPTRSRGRFGHHSLDAGCLPVDSRSRVGDVTSPAALGQHRSLRAVVTSVAQHTVAELHADWSAATLTSDLTYNHFRRNLTGSAWSDFIFRYHVAFSQTSPVVRPHLFARGTRCGLLLPMFRGLCVGLRVSVICLAVCWSRRESSNNSKPYNTTEPIETLFGVWNRGAEEPLC